MKGEGINQATVSWSVQAAYAALLLLLTVVSASSVERPDPQILPVSPRYVRNAQCETVHITMPPGTHRLPGSNLISPKPADIPVGQGESAICFAYSAADMISQRIGRAVSPLDVATKFYFADPTKLATVRNPTLQAHLQAHPTYQADIAWSRNTADISTDHNPELQPYFDKLEGGEEDAAALLYNLGGFCEERDLPSHESYAHFTRYYAALRFSSSVRMPNQCLRRVGATVDKLRSRRADAFKDAWLRQVEARCQRKPLPIPLLPISYRVANTQLEFMEMLEEGQAPSPKDINRMLSMVDYALDHGRAPSVGYSWYVIGERDPKDPDVAADHSSAVIARRRIAGRCQYRVQDNTGEYCTRMRGDVRERCEDGRIWLWEDELKRSLYSVIYLR